MHRRPAPAGPAGFTLVEILLAVSLGALLLMATASSAGLFGAKLQALDEDTDSALQAALAGVADETRYAWTAEVPDRASLVLTDPAGRQTTYAFARGQLTVTRPDGTQGVLADGLAAASFRAETLTRYREAAPVSRMTTFWSSAAPAGTAQATVLDAGDRLALGFTPSSVAPVPGTTPGVTEQMTGSTLDTLSITLASIAPLASGGAVTISLHRARAPGDGRPEGAALASVSVALTALPEATSHVWNSRNGKVVKVPKKAVWGWWTSHDTYELVVEAPTVQTTFDVSLLGAQVQPGHAYTLVLEPTGSGVALAGYATGSATRSGVALAPDGGVFAAQALAVPRGLSGTVSMTRTTATPVVQRVLLSLTDADGTQLASSATVLGQGLAEHPWLGVVPGDVGP